MTCNFTGLHECKHVQKYTQKQTHGLFSFPLNTCSNVHPPSVILDTHTHSHTPTRPLSVCQHAVLTLPCCILSFYSTVYLYLSILYTDTRFLIYADNRVFLCSVCHHYYAHIRSPYLIQCCANFFISSPHVSKQSLGPVGDLMECVFYRPWKSTPCC